MRNAGNVIFGFGLGSKLVKKDENRTAECSAVYFISKATDCEYSRRLKDSLSTQTRSTRSLF